MVDIAALTKRAHDTGFEKGSIVACNAILAYLQRQGHQAIAADVLTAWNDNTLVEQPAPVQPDPLPLAHFEPGPAKMTFEQAKGSGYTGNQCTHCSSMRMTISGHCEKCEDCGESSGCS